MSQDEYKLPRDGAEQQLDELICQSLEFEVDADRLERLEHFWRQQQGVAPLRQWRRRVLAVAAAVLIVFVWSLQPREKDSPVVVERAPDAAPVREPIRETDIAPPPAPATNGLADSREISPLSGGRTPTAYEQAMFISQGMPPVKGNLTAEQVVRQSIDRMAEDPELDPAALMRAASKQQRPAVKWTAFRDQLVTNCEGASPDRQIAACRLLATYDQKRAITILLALAQQSQASDSSLTAIEQIAGQDQWLRIARESAHSQTRRAIARRMLTFDSEVSLLTFVRMVEDKMLREDALAAARDETELPVAKLIAMLDSEEPTVRLATALTLGELNRCEMTSSLISRIYTRPSQSTEAWFALFACECEAADQFLTRATYDPKLLGQFNHARLQWAQASY